MTKTKKQTGWRPFFQLVRQTNPSKVMIGIALLLSLATTGVGLLVPLFTKNLINDFSLSSLSPGRIAMLVLAIVVQALASGFSIYLLNRIGQSVVAGIRDQLWKKLLVLPVSYFDEHPSGETVSRMTNDTSVVKGLISEHLANFITGIISIIGSIIVLIVLDWKMTLLMFIAIPLSALILVPLGKKMHQISKGMQDETASFTSILQQVLSEIRLVKASNAESLEYENGKKGIMNLFQFGLKEAKIQALIGPLMSLVMMALLVLILGYGGMRVSTGAITAGALVAFIMYLFQIIMPMAQLAQFFTQFQKATGATERIRTILDAEVEEDGNQLAENMNETISINNIHYHYPNGEEVLKDINFNIEAGKTTATVGPSGSGKTTLFSLFERFYTPQQGTISIGEKTIHDFSLLSWRSQIGYVSQESPIVAGTIRDNICYGLDRLVPEEELQEVAKMAYADQFIMDVSLDQLFITADEELMSQVWTNLIHNSIKFTPSSGQLSIRLQLIEHQAVISITDTGIGISEQDQLHVFERFFKADLARDRTKSGSGLGLSIVKKIVEMHEGQISVESKFGVGTTFKVVLPIL